MQAIKTKYFKGFRGYKAESIIDLTEVSRLIIETFKRHDKHLRSTAYVSHKEGTFYAFMPFSDFNTEVESDNCARVTPKAVKEQHLKALNQIDVLKLRAFAHYSLTNPLQTRALQVAS